MNVRHWLKRLRGAAFMGVFWGLAWGLGVGGTIELLLNLGLGTDWMRRVDMWPATLAIPGFISGAMFSIVLGAAGFGRKVEELSTTRFAAWGALGGLLGGAVTIGLWGIGGPLGIGLFLGIPAALGALSASGILAVARKGERQLIAAPDESERLTNGEGR